MSRPGPTPATATATAGRLGAEARCPHRTATCRGHSTAKGLLVDISQLLALAQNPQIQSLHKGLLSLPTGANGERADLTGLVNQLWQGGLGDQVKSWESQGDNQPVTAVQISEVLGTSKLDQAASQAGLTPEDAAQDLADVLPSLVDRATPNGELPTPHGSVDDLLKQLISGSNTQASH
ncbi:YidB family protein [Streptomyces sp. NPDC060187]|uniref:YidB family protein n=1 Tax=Streptomyces sp. NPDC060187 TaxID=3347067 RepID=UPI003655DCCB